MPVSMRFNFGKKQTKSKNAGDTRFLAFVFYIPKMQRTMLFTVFLFNRNGATSAPEPPPCAAVRPPSAAPSAPPARISAAHDKKARCFCSGLILLFTSCLRSLHTHPIQQKNELHSRFRPLTPFHRSRPLCRYKDRNRPPSE